MKPSGNLSLRRFCLLLFMLVSYTDTYVLAAPRGGQVVSGTASFQQNGNLTVITAGNHSIINYGSFNIAAGETVRFVQPSAQSSVLNRVVGSVNPTEIFGTLQANGHVYIANPYGIFFRNGSVINVGGLYAGAGNLSDADFTKGKIHFTDLAGDVRNDGIILANDHLALMGVNVVNNGTLRADTGVVMMVSGKDVYVSEKNSSLFVRANGNPSTTVSATGGSVINRGTVAAPRVLLGGGDLYSTAIANSGLLQGSSVVVNAGRNGTATVSGTVDATSAHNPTSGGTGGSIQVLGGTVALQGATLDASGATGGGSVRVGGDFHGGGTLAHATTTTVDATTTIKADATGSGDGGTVVLWSDVATDYAGQISARGGATGGNGGAVEVSSHGGLGFHGPVDTSAPAGKVGSLLLDPTNIEITNSLAPDAGFVLNPTATANTTGTPGTLTVSQGSLQSTLAAITLTASNDIRVDALSGGTLTLAGTAAATFTAGANLSNGTASKGSFVMVDLTNTISNPGQNITINANGASGTGGINTDSNAVIAVGNLTTANAALGTNGGAVALNITGATAAPVRIGSITTSSSNGTAGNITVGGALLTGNIVTGQGTGNTGNLAAVSTGTGGLGAADGAGGVVTLNTTGTVMLNGPVTTSSAGASAGAIQVGTTAIPAGLTTTDVLTAQATGTTAARTGNGGAVTLNSTGPITVGGAVNASSASAAGGAIKVAAGGNVQTGNLNAGSAASTAAAGGVGSITVTGTGTVLVNNVTTSSAAGPGGVISIGNAAATGITTGTAGSNPVTGLLTSSGTTTGGAVTLTAAGPITVNGAINAATTGTGAGGTVNIATAATAAATATGVSTAGITTTSTGGAGGAVTIANATGAGTRLPTSITVGAINTAGMGTTNGGAISLQTTGVLTLSALSPVFTGNATLLANTTNATSFTTDGYNFSLTLNGAPISLSSVLDTPNNLVLGGQQVVLDEAAFSSNGSQTYNAPTVLTHDVALTSGGGGNIRFNSTVQGPFALTLDPNGTGIAVFNGVVGGTPATDPTSLTVNGGTNILGGGAVTTVGAQDFTGAVGLSLNTTLTSPTSTVTVGSLTGNNHDLTVAGTGSSFGTITSGGSLVFNDGAGGATFTGAVNATSLTRNGTGLTSFPNGAAVTTSSGTLGQSYGGGVQLGGDVSLTDTLGGPITLTGAVTGTTAGGQNLSLNTTGATTLVGAVGTSALPLASLSTNLGGTTALDGGSVFTTGAQTYADALTLGANTILTSTASGAISLNSTVAGGGFALTVDTGGLTTFGGTVSALSSLTTDAGGTTALNTGSITTTGAQSFNDAVTLGANTTLTSTASGAITFASTINGDTANTRTLTLSTVGNQTFGGAVGGTAPLASFATGTGAVALNGGVVNTSGTQTFNGALTLGADTMLSTTNANATTGAIAFNSTVGGAGFNLTTATQGGNTVFGSASGSVPGALLGSLTTSANGSTVFNDTAFETSGSQNYQGATVVQSAIRALALTSDSGNITFGGALTSPAASASDLTLTANGGTGQAVTFGGTVGGGVTTPSATALNSLTVNSPTININGGLVNTASTNPRGTPNDGVQTYNGAVLLGADGTFVGKTVTASGGIDAQNHNLTLTLSSLVTVPLGTGFTNINGFASNGAGGTNIVGDFTTTGFQHYDNVTTLGANVTLTAGTDGIRFGSTLGSGVGGPYSLALSTGGPVAFNGVVGGSGGPLTSLSITGGGTTSIDGGAITTTDFQNYGGPVLLGATGGLTTLTSNGGGQIAFSTTLNGVTAGTQSLVLNTTGTMIFNDLVGFSAALRGLTTGPGTADINSASVTTQGGGQDYQGPVSFDGTAGKAVALTDLANGALTFGSTVDNFASGAPALTLSTGGAITFSGALGGTGALGSLTTTGGGTTAINGGSVLTSGLQTYNGPVTLGSTATLTSTAGGAVTFGSTLNGTAAGAQGLTVNTSGNEVFGGLVGNNFALASLTTDAAGTVGGQTQFNMTVGPAAQGVNVTGSVTTNDAVLFAATGSTLANPTVRTGGSQAYNGGGTATQNTALIGGGTLTSAGGLNFGGNDLSVRFGGLVTVPGAFTSVRNFASDGAGGTLVNGAFTTTGSQTYGDAVTLTGAPTLTGVGNITFNSTVDGNAPLTLNVTGANSLAVFNGLVGNTIMLNGLTTNTSGGTQFRMDAGTAATGNGGVNVGAGGVSITGPVLFAASNSTTAHPTVASTGAQTYNGAATLAQNTTLVGTGDITFGSTMDGAFALSASAAGNEVFDGLVGGTTALTGLTTDEVGTPAGQAQFNFAIGGAQAGVRVNGPITLNDAALFNLTGTSVSGTAVVPSVLTLGNGAQTYGGTVTLGSQTVFASTAGAPAAGTAFSGGGQITFNANVTSANVADRQNLYVRTDVGQTRILGGLDANTTDLGGATATFQGEVGPVNLFSVESNAGTGGSVAVGGNITTSGPQVYNAALVLPVNSVFTAGGNIVFNSTVDSDSLATPRSLTLNTAGLTIFNGLVGNNVPLLSLTTDNQGAAGEGTQFNMNLTAPGTVAGVSVINAVTINDPVTFNAAGSSLAVPTILTGVNGGTGSQTYASGATLARDTVLTDLGAGNVAFGSTVNGGFNLFVNTGGDEIFNGLVGNTTALTSLQTDLVGTPGGSARFNMSLAPAGTMAGVRVTGITNIRDGVVFNAADNGGTIPTILSGGAQTYAQAATLSQDTILTSSGNGNLTFASTLDGPSALTLNTGGVTVFNGAVGGTTPLASLTTDAAGSTQFNGGTIITSGAQIYNDPVLLGANTSVTSGTNVFFGSTVDGPFNLSLGADNLLTFNAAVGGISPLTSLTTLAGGTLQINGGAVTTSAVQTYGNAVSLGAAAVLTSTNAGNITFNSTLDGLFALTVNTGGTTAFNGQVGAVSPLASLTTDAAGNTSLKGGAVTTSGAQIYGDAVSLGTDAVLSSNANGNVTFASTVNGPFALTINTGGVTQFNAATGSQTALASLTTDAPGSTVLDGGVVFTTGTQSYGDALTLARDTTLTSTGSGDLRFGQTVNGAFALTLNTAGTTVLGGSVGGTTPLASVTTDTPGTTQFNGSGVTTSGAQTYRDPSFLVVDTTLASAGGSILFGNTLNSAAGTARNLTVNTTGRTEFDGLVGSTAALGSVTTDAGGITLINGGGITTVHAGATTGAQTYNDAVRLGADTLLASLATGATAGGNLTFNATVDGAFALTLNTGALTVFNGVVGGTTALTGLTTDNAGATGEGTRFNMTVGAAPAGVVVNGPVQINDAVLFNVQGSSLAQPGVLTLGDHGQAYNGAVTLGSSTYLTSAMALPTGGAGYTGGGGIRFNSPAGIRGAGGNDLYVRGAVGATTIASTVNVGSIDLGGAQAVFNGPINLPGTLSVLPNDGGTGGSIVFSGGSLTTAGMQNFRAGIILGADTVLTSLNTANDGGNITFAGTVDSDAPATARALSLNTSGDEIFNGLVGSRAALASLTTDAPGPVGGTARFNMSLVGTPTGTAGVNALGAVAINDAVNFNVAGSSLVDGSHPTIFAGGAQTYNGAATLAQNTALVSGAGGTLTFNSAVDGGSGLALSSAGDEVFNGLVGRQTALASLDTDVVQPSGGQARFNMDTAGTGPGVNVTGAVTINDGVTFNAANAARNGAQATVLSGGTQTYNGPATLAQDAVLTSNAGNLVFNGTLDGAFFLATNSGGIHAFNGLVGSAAPLDGLTTNGGGTQFNANLSGSSAAAGVRVAGALTVNGTVLFNVLGGSESQPSVLTLGGSQTYNGAATVAQNTVLNGGSGNLLFAATVDGASALTLDASGNTTLNGAVGGTTPLASLTTDAGGGTFLGAGTVVTSGLQNYGDAVLLTKAATLTSTAGGVLTFGSSLDGAFDLTLNSAGLEVFNGAVGNVTPLTSLTTDADPSTLGGTAVFNFALGNGVANSVLTSGAQTYNDGVTLRTSAVLTSQNGAITAASVAGGGADLTVNAATSTFGGIANAGNLLFAVRGVTTLNGPITGSSLAVRGGTLVALNAGTVTTTVGGQSYEEPVTLGLDTTLNAAGLVNVASLDGGNHALTLTAPVATFGVVTQGGDLLWNVSGQTTLNGTVDAASLRVMGNGPVALNGGQVTTTGNQLYSGAVTLGTDTALNAGSATINVGSLAGKGKALTLTARRATFGQIGNAGTLDFIDGTAAVFNGTVAANSLNVTGDTALNGGTVRTAGDQNYRGTVALGAAVSLTSTGGAINAPRLLTGSGHDLAVAAPNVTFGQISGTGATTFQDNGTTTLNGTVDATSLGVSGGQLLTLNGGRITTSAFQDYAQPVVMGGDTQAVSSGAGNVSFDSTLDGARNLTVNTVGTAVFGGAVGGTTRLASLTVANGAASITGGSVQTTGNQQYDNAVTTSTADAAGTRLTSDTSDMIFNNTVTGNGGALFVQGHRVLMHGDTTINGGNLSLNSVEVPGTAVSSLLLLDGRNYVSNGGGVILNGAESTTSSSLSTIVLTNTGTVNIRGANFTMGYLQKLFAAGALNIDVGRGVATVGDLAARQTLRVNAREIDLLNRPAGVGDGKRPNTGLNFVADQGINFGDATIQYARPDNQTASFITTSGVTTIQRRTGLSIFRDPNLDTQFRDDFTRDGEGFFLVDNPFQPVGGGSQTLDTAAAISGALPDQKPLDVPVDVTITAGQMEELRKLGIHPRKAQSSEQGTPTARQALFAQLADGQDADNYGRLQPIKGAVSVLVPSDYVVVVNRMSEREVQAILQAFEQLYGKNKEKAPQIGAAYQKSFDEYTVAKQTADPAGFGPYLKESHGKYPDVDQAGRGFDNLFGYIEHMGLTPVEVKKAESYIVSDLNVNGPTSDDMVKVIDTQRKNLPPAQKAGSTKLPPAPPMAAPAPATSPAPAPAAKKDVPPKSARATKKDETHRTAHQPKPVPNTGHSSELAGL